MEPFGQRGRLLAIVLLLMALFGLFVWYGTLSYDPAMNNFPDKDDIGPNLDAYVGERIALSGEVTAIDPVTIKVTHRGSTMMVVLENATTTLQNTDGPIEVGRGCPAGGRPPTARY